MMFSPSRSSRLTLELPSSLVSRNVLITSTCSILQMPNVTPDKSTPSPVSEIVEDSQCPDQETPYKTVLSPGVGLFKQQYVLDSEDVVENRQQELPAENPDICKGRTASQDGYKCGHEKSREAVIKEIGISSAAFIGPACRPEAAIEEELSEFYKELEEINHQDRISGATGADEGDSQSTPTLNPCPRNETWASVQHRYSYRPYPLVRAPKDYGCSRKWRPQSHNELPFSDPYHIQDQWHHPRPRLPHGPPMNRFNGPQHFFSPPLPGNPLHPPYLQPQLNDYSRGWQRPRLPLGYDVGSSPSYCSESFEWQYKCSNDWQHYEEQEHHGKNQHQQNNRTCSVLVLMRGVPGSGKSTLAKKILSSGPNGLILSTDDYFFQEDRYSFDPALLGKAHDWNQRRARDAMLSGCSPVIIDNTNVQAWEMKPYVTLALEFGYRVEFAEPDTSWKCDPAELENLSAAAQCSVDHPLVLHEPPQDAAPQDAAPQDAAPQDAVGWIVLVCPAVWGAGCAAQVCQVQATLPRRKYRPNRGASVRRLVTPLLRLLEKVGSVRGPCVTNRVITVMM
ncbi:hypothetical protein NFI96_006312 [Prochilodus magdalenae]|nr:hypothetical protein NFI96_006312 [Prochilodus magdalenae]